MLTGLPCLDDWTREVDILSLFVHPSRMTLGLVRTNKKEPIMTIVVSTPTGNIGRRITEKLLDAKSDVTILARSPEKVADLAARGAKVRQGSLEDADFVARATEGASTLFWLTPPNMVSDDVRAFQLRLGKNAAAAIKKNGIGRVVNLSSVGAQHASGVGLVTGLHHVERAIDEVAANVTHLRAGYFMENLLHSADTIKSVGSIFAPLPADLPFSMVATHDIGDVAAARILDESWRGRTYVGVHGPEDLSLAKAAAILSEALGKPIAYVQVPPSAVADALKKLGVSASMIDGFLEMYAGFASGLGKAAEPRTAATTTPTSLASFAREVLKPLVS